jgi:hypothetical protein
MNYALEFIADLKTICKQIWREKIEHLAHGFAQLREAALGADRKRWNCGLLSTIFGCGVNGVHELTNLRWIEFQSH